MPDFTEQAKDFADKHDEQIDKGMDKAGDAADEKTGGRYSEQIDKAVDAGQEHTGGNDRQE